MGVLKAQRGSILLISCYELGHQPAGIWVPMAFLKNAGYEVDSMDVSVEGFDREKVSLARFVGISVPMHTALRLGIRVGRAIRRINPNCHICYYGLYASLNEDYLLESIADSVMGGEFEESLVRLIESIDSGVDDEVEAVSTRKKRAVPVMARQRFPVPDRTGLVSVERYARLEIANEERLVGYVEASRGCLHMCTHCPIPPVYNGRFFIVPADVVLEDIRRLAATGVRHITFGDPDFLNGPGHSQRLVSTMHDQHPGLTFDFTAKIEHILKHRGLMSEFADAGCVFVVSAVESLSGLVLGKLEKGHTRADVLEALAILRSAGIALRPSFVSFTPWTTLDDMDDLLDFVETNNLIDHVDPVQYSIRLLIPPGSLVLSGPDVSEWIGGLNQETLSYDWSHPDPAMDRLQRRITEAVEEAACNKEDPAHTFYRIRELTSLERGRSYSRARNHSSPLRVRPPRLTEAWFC